MIHRLLGDTLVALVSALTPIVESGLVVTHADLDVPLEVTGVIERGGLVFYGNVPHSRWRAGFLPPVHLSHLAITLIEDDTQDA